MKTQLLTIFGVLTLGFAWGLQETGDGEHLKSNLVLGNEKLEAVICPGGVYQCPSGYTCCPGLDSPFVCCPLLQATCCSDRVHCCPFNYRCTPQGCFYGGLKSEFLKVISNTQGHETKEAELIEEKMMEELFEEVFGNDQDRVAVNFL